MLTQPNWENNRETGSNPYRRHRRRQSRNISPSSCFPAAPPIPLSVFWRPFCLHPDQQTPCGPSFAEQRIAVTRGVCFRGKDNAEHLVAAKRCHHFRPSLCFWTWFHVQAKQNPCWKRLCNEIIWWDTTYNAAFRTEKQYGCFKGHHDTPLLPGTEVRPPH